MLDYLQKFKITEKIIIAFYTDAFMRCFTVSLQMICSFSFPRSRYLRIIQKLLNLKNYILFYVFVNFLYVGMLPDIFIDNPCFFLV